MVFLFKGEYAKAGKHLALGMKILWEISEMFRISLSIWAD
jgi:hypothetical protein